MRKTHLTLLITVAVGLLAVEAYGQTIDRLSAQYLSFNGETLCVAQSPACPAAAAGGTGGELVYSHTVFVPLISGSPVLFVSFAAQGDQHGGSAEFLSCNINGSPCNAGGGGAGGAPTGWVNVGHHFQYQNVTYCSGLNQNDCRLTAGDGGGGSGDAHDNTIYAHWCVHVSPGLNTVNIRLANGATGTTNPAGVTNIVYFEKAHIFIDAAQPAPGNDCTNAH
jgi:hypothetical protein